MIVNPCKETTFTAKPHWVMAGIYFHIPFCRKACHYCNFHFSTSLKYKNEMIEAILHEVELRKEFLNGEDISTIYFGGGTPSILSEKEIRKIMDKVQAVFKPSKLVEVTLEANPDDITKEKIKEFKNAGVDRLSIGVQSFFEEDLLYMNRSHNATQAEYAIKLAQDGGIENLSVDLIFGFPLLSNEKWKSNLKSLVQWQVPHISTYAMTIEAKTALENLIAKGKLPNIDAEISALQYEYVMQYLEDNGYEHYEISSFGLQGKRAVHNSSYWTATPYLGIGPSAHSFDGVQRQWNVSNNMKYMHAIERHTPDREVEILTEIQKLNERIMIGLRTKDGIAWLEMQTQIPASLVAKWLSIVEKYEKNGMLYLELNRLKLTKKGKLYADGIASELFV